MPRDGLQRHSNHLVLILKYLLKSVFIPKNRKQLSWFAQHIANIFLTRFEEDVLVMVTTARHKVFVSYHHELDEKYKIYFCRMLGFDIVDKSVDDGDIDPYLRTDTIRQKIRDDFIADATVTVVLVGKCTWQRKHVDWEIGSSLRDTKLNSRCGLLGILLPTHYDFGGQKYNKYLVPPRLADNSGRNSTFATIYDWPNPWNPTLIQGWIHSAYQRRLLMPPPINNRTQFVHNRTGDCSKGWSD